MICIAALLLFAVHTTSIECYCRIGWEGACSACSAGCTSQNWRCVACNDSCTNCNGGANKCNGCVSGYYLQSGDKSPCLLCSDKFGEKCLECDRNSGCKKCENGYQLINKTTQKCGDFNEGCTLCSNNVCSQCSEGYYLDSIKNLCVKCNNKFSKCSLCSENECYACGDNSTLSNKLCVECNQRWEGCVGCNDIMCSSCQQNGYYNSNGFCNKCSANCESCQSKEMCDVCKSGYYFNGGKCESCSTRNCKLCDNSKCESCLENSFLNNGMCVSCKEKIPNCEKCNGDNVDTQCLFCSNGFYSNGPQCVQCDTSCGSEGCVNRKCTNCKDNKILDRSGKCVEPTNCDSVDDSRCAVCKDGYYLYNNICVQKASNTPCNSIQITEDVCLSKEDAGCDEVLNGKCASCQSELILDNEMCKSCSSSIQNCTSCATSSTESIMCSVCREGFFPEKTCKSCKMIYGCELCVNLLVGNVESTRICTKCLSGYYLQDGECLQIKNCVANTGIECTKCEINFIVEEGECKEYTTQLGCIATDGVFCTTCSDGFYLSPESRRCLSCSVASCSRCDTTGKCVECNTNNSLKDGKCEKCGIVGCSLCNSTGIDCLRCDKTHFSTTLPTTQCTECTTKTNGCLECTSEHCTICQDGYFINTTDHTCNSCKVIEGCTACSLETGKCFKCLDGFYLVSGQCALCNNTMQRCGRCSSESNCNSCEEGYFLEENTCHKCSEIDGCEICDESSRLCFKCKDYYTALVDGNGYKCVDCETAHENCSSCSVDGNCTECESSFMLKEGVCVECSTSNPNCHVCATKSSRCLSCGVGYGVDDNGQCQKCISVNCLDCE
ncbi:hypothetical protein EIN_088130, partial [Entamoeba invadens IP1]|uniref:hypothetical protein n=1 Tax=Entamoeba invadens IP1 TaxID=370355 RepID=UPI0002C3E8A1